MSASHMEMANEFLAGAILSQVPLDMRNLHLSFDGFVTGQFKLHGLLENAFVFVPRVFCNGLCNVVPLLLLAGGKPVANAIL